VHTQAAARSFLSGTVHKKPVDPDPRGVALTSDKYDSDPQNPSRGPWQDTDGWTDQRAAEARPSGPEGVPARPGAPGSGGATGARSAGIGSGDAAADETIRRRRRRRRIILASAAAFVVLAAGGLTALGFERQSAYDRNIRRITKAFPTNPDRPPAGPAGAENWLLLGSDRRGKNDPGYGKIGGERADTIILAHLPADRKGAFLVSIPRDSWVTIPGRGKSKINAAYAYGGSALLIQTVEKLTSARIDHFGIIDFEGMRSMTNALGGVDVRVNQTVHDPKNKVTWKAGVNHLNGDLALKFVRQRYGLPGGDFDRIKRQQAFLKALAKKAVSRGTFTNPLKLNAFLDALTKSVSVDDSVRIADLRSRAISFRDLRANDIAFMTVPTKGTGSVGGQSVVLLNQTKAPVLYDALRRDRVGDYLKTKKTANSVDEVS
jgi:LCP family protein required for cell wall assembly